MIPVTIGSRASQRAAFDLLQTNRSPSSSWRETAETRERARDAENELALSREAARSLRTQLHAAEQQRRDDVRALEKQIASLKTRVAEEAARADDRVETIVSSEAKKHEALNERHSRLRREHAALQAAVGRAGGGARGASDLETALTSERDERFTAQLELVERNVRLEGRRAYDALERAKETQITQLREQSDAFLADARAELATARSEMDKEKKHSEKTITELVTENDALRTWARSMNEVLRKIEEGAYPVVERGFWRSLRVPPAETRFSKTVPSAERTRAIARASANTSAFLEHMEDDAMATSGTAEFRSKNETKSYAETKSSIGDVSAAPAVSGAVPVAFGVSTTRPVDPYDTVAYDRSHRNNRAGETFELEAFKKHGDLVEEERVATQEATLRELASHPTVEYIRALEEENAKVKGELSRERRSNSDARVALQSARRQHDTLITEKKVRRNRASSARPASAFGATTPKETFVGPPMSPESFRATLNGTHNGTHVIRTHAGLTSTSDTTSGHKKNGGLTSPEVVERVRVTTLSRDAARRAEARRARGGVDRNAAGASVGYLANQTLDSRDAFAHTKNNTNPDSIKRNAGGSGGSTSPRPPFGTAGGRRLTDVVPVAGRPLSGSAEVGYGFVLGDGPDAAGGAVGWPAGADRTKSLAERPATGPGGVRSGGAKRAGGAAAAP